MARKKPRKAAQTPPKHDHGFGRLRIPRNAVVRSGGVVADYEYDWQWCGNWNEAKKAPADVEGQ